MSNCNIRKIPLGPSSCAKMPQLISSMIWTPDDFSATEAQLSSKTFWQNAVKADPQQRANIWPYFDTFENISQEAVYEDTPLSYLAVRDGNYRFKFGIAQGLCLHRAMFTHRAKNGRVWFYDQEGQIICTKGVDGKYRGLSVQLLHTEKLMFNDGSVVTKSPVVVALRNNVELDKNGYIFDAEWFTEVVRLKDVTLTVVSASLSTLVVSVTVTCDGSPVNGLTNADFVVLDNTGASQGKTLASQNNGVYTFNAQTTFVDGTVDLVAASALSIDAYESSGAVAFDVP